MRRFPWFRTLFLLGSLLVVVMATVQSQFFATKIKNFLSTRMPSDLGLIGDFSEINVRFLPPGLSIRNPKIRVIQKNALNLPVGASVMAERMDLNFSIIQLMTGNLKVKEIVIVNGDVKSRIQQERQPLVSQKHARVHLQIPWEQLLSLRIDAFRLQNTHVELEFVSNEQVDTLEFEVSSLRVSQWMGRSGPGVQMELETRKFHGSVLQDYPGIENLDAIAAELHVNVAGLVLDEFLLRSQGFDLVSKGNVKGNLKSTTVRDLQMDFDVESKGDFAHVLALLGMEDLSKDTRGAYTFKGKVQGDPRRIKETLKAEGVLKATDVAYQKFYSDSAEFEGQWLSTSAGVEVTLSKGVLKTEKRERKPPLQAASGGSISAGPLHLKLDSQGKLIGGESFQIPIRLDHAHIHWLASSALKSVYGLNFTVTGPVNVDLKKTSEKKWGAKAEIALAVDGFRLDNQRIGLTRANRNLLQIPQNVQLKGSIVVDPQAVHPDVLVETGLKSKIQVTGQIDYDKGYDLKGVGITSLADVKTISEIPISGEGPLSVSVVGPTSAVQIHFDGDLKDATYLNLKLGSLKGRITWDDDRDFLIFKNVQLSKSRTQYGVDGFFNFHGDDGKVDLNLSAHQGNVEDFIHIFDFMISDLWWFPASLNGPCQATAHLTGGVSMDNLVVQSHLDGHDWQYKGESFKKVAVDIGYDKGKYLINHLDATKHIGHLQGGLTFDKDQTFDWNLKSDHFQIVDLDFLSSLDVPIRGTLAIDSKGHGKPVREKAHSIQSQTTVSVGALAVRGKRMPASQLSIQSDSGVLNIKGNAFEGQASGELLYDFYPGSQSSLRGDLKNFDFSPVLLLLNPALIRDPVLTGTISGGLQVKFFSGDIEHATGHAQLTQYLMGKAGRKFELVSPVDFKINQGSFDSQQFILKSKESEATLSLSARSGVIDGTVSGDVDLGAIEFLTPVIVDTDGSADVDLSIRGKLKEAEFSGRAIVEGAVIKVSALESPLENVNATLVLRQNLLTLQKFDADLAGGTVTGNGTVTLFASHYPALDLKSTLSGNKLKIYPFQYVKVKGNLGLHGDELPYVIDGEIWTEGALIKEKVFNQKRNESLKAIQYLPTGKSVNLSGTDQGGSKFKLDISTHADGGVIVQNDLLVDAEFKGNLKLVNTLEAPRVLGTVDLIHGKMKFKDREFTIQGANAEFDNPTVINPRFNLTSNTEVNGTKIQLYVSGRMNSMKAELSSNPALAEPEILSLLAVGMTSSDTKRLNAGDRSTVEQGEAASLLLNSLDFNREVQNKTGFQIQLDESVNSQLGTSVFRPQTSADSVTAPKIVIRRRVGDQLDLSYGSTVGVGANIQKEGAAEYHVKKGFSVMGVFDDFEQVGTQGDLKSYGVDLKWQKRFK